MFNSSATWQLLYPIINTNPHFQLWAYELKLTYHNLNSRVKDKVIIVTGANSALGIGRASAHLFAASGAQALYLCDLNDSNLPTHKRELAALYPDTKVHTEKLDATNEEQVAAVCEAAIKQYGRLDIMFANAGVANGVRLHELSGEAFMENVKINLLSVFLCAKYASQAMMVTSKGKPYPGGSIIGTASVAGIRSNAGGSDYSAGKAGVVSLAQTISYQLAGTGVRMNAICPGLIETGMTSAMFEMARSRGSEGKIGQLNPLRRAAVADEVARVALFLGSDESSYVNGQAWAVDGGLSAGK